MASFSRPRPEAYAGSPTRGARPLSLKGFESQKNILERSPLLPPCDTSKGLSDWRDISRDRLSSSPTKQLTSLLTPDEESEDPFLSIAGPDIGNTTHPFTPHRPAFLKQLVNQGLISPPETPQQDTTTYGLQAQEPQTPLFDTFTPPVTPGLAVSTQPFEDDAGSTTTVVPRLPKRPNHVRFAPLSRSIESATASDDLLIASDSFESDDDSQSTISSFEEHGISRPASPKPKELAESVLPLAPQPLEEPTQQAVQEPKSEFDIFTRVYKGRCIPDYARVGCAQCLRLNLPCNKSMPECTRCARRAAQRNSYGSYSAPASAADSCCVPMLFTKAACGAVRPVPIFQAYAEELRDYVPFENLEGAKKELENRRRAAYDAIVAEDTARACQRNWVLPRVRGAAVDFQGREITRRYDGTPVLRRTQGVDGPSKPRVWVDGPNWPLL